MRNISIYRDFGTSAELRDGLNGGERLVLNLPADAGDGGKVKVQEDQHERQSQPDGLQASQKRS
jgi:HlyD family secretion protein